LPIANCQLRIADSVVNQGRALFQSETGNWQSAMFLFRFFMTCVLTAASAELLELQTIGSCLFVLRRHVIAALTVTALQYNIVSWHNSFPISACVLSVS
jgi:hypothetical protein